MGITEMIKIPNMFSDYLTKQIWISRGKNIQECRYIALYYWNIGQISEDMLDKYMEWSFYEMVKIDQAIKRINKKWNWVNGQINYIL
jgi:hypothetical protein